MTCLKLCLLACAYSITWYVQQRLIFYLGIYLDLGYDVFKALPASLGLQQHVVCAAHGVCSRDFCFAALSLLQHGIW